MTEAKDTSVQSNGNNPEPIGTPESTVKAIDPKDPKGAAELASVAAGNMSKAAKALTDIPPPPKVPRH